MHTMSAIDLGRARGSRHFGVRSRRCTRCAPQSLVFSKGSSELLYLVLTHHPSLCPFRVSEKPIMTGQKPLKLFLFLFIFTIGSFAQSLLDVLRKEGFTQWAAVLESPGNAGILNFPDNLILFAPTNAALARQQLSGNAIQRRLGFNDLRAEFLAVPRSGTVGPYKRSNPTCNPDVAGPGTEDLMTLLSDPDFVNLPLGQNASIVQKNMPKGTLPIVLTGLGDTVRVIAEDIPFDKGVIRPISGWFTLPQLLSETLPFLGADNVLGVLERTGLMDDFDNRTGITFLAPEDQAFPSHLADDVLADILRRHLIVGLPTFTSDINHGDTFRTLAGTTVTVTITCGEVSIGGARILSGDTIIKNGVVHIIDSLMEAPIVVTTTQVQTVTETEKVVETLVETTTQTTVQTLEATQTATETVELPVPNTTTTTETVTPCLQSTASTTQSEPEITSAPSSIYQPPYTTSSNLALSPPVPTFGSSAYTPPPAPSISSSSGIIPPSPPPISSSIPSISSSSPSTPISSSAWTSPTPSSTTSESDQPSSSSPLPPSLSPTSQSTPYAESSSTASEPSQPSSSSPLPPSSSSISQSTPYAEPSSTTSESDQPSSGSPLTPSSSSISESTPCPESSSLTSSSVYIPPPSSSAPPMYPTYPVYSNTSSTEPTEPSSTPCDSDQTPPTPSSSWAVYSSTTLVTSHKPSSSAPAPPVYEPVVTASQSPSEPYPGYGGGEY